MNNLERIHSMSVDEMIDLINTSARGELNYCMFEPDECMKRYNGDGDCDGCLRAWLKKECGGKPTESDSAIYDWSQLPVVINLRTVALVLGVSELTVKRWLYDGTLKAKKLGKVWLFDREYIRRLVSVEGS